MVEYPGNYIGQCFLLKDFTADNINNYVYSCDYFLPWTFSSDSFVIYDYRDNKSSPTIIENESYDMYVIFLGNKMLYNEINLEFALISLDKCE